MLSAAKNLLSPEKRKSGFFVAKASQDDGIERFSELPSSERR
jgi:hypothetical protein